VKTVLTTAGIPELKPLLMKQSDKFARNLAEKLMTYATGREPNIQNQLEADKIGTSKPASETGFRSLIEEIVLSDGFRK